MVRVLRSDAADFAAQFEDFLADRDAVAADVRGVVTDIITRVRREGDAAVAALTAQFDKLTLTEGALAFTAEQRAEIRSRCPAPVREALRLAATRIHAFHETQKPQDTG
ncbi:MAG: histidinol dehydrogenase, partial [Alphaproteobacteria bacterium]|nr:histidinol dehydrogenase [Alphaproteobacteria bacterium]